MFKRLKRRHEARRQQEDDHMLLRIYHRGFHARMEGLPRTPPAGYDVTRALDFVGWWTAGWEEADGVLARAAGSLRAA